MASPRPPSLAQAHHYRLPELLHDIRLLDLLELCGTTVQTSRHLQLSQPTISRRYRLLSEDFGLVRDRRQLWGCGYGTSAAMRLLRLGCRAHRLAAGVARLGSDLLHHPLLAGCPWLLPTPQRFRAAANWLELVRQGVLDGALISGLELEEAEGLNHQELELLPLGRLPLALAFCPEAPVLVGAVPGRPASEGRVAEVLVPDRGVAPGLRRLLRELGLPLRSGGNSLQTQMTGSAGSRAAPWLWWWLTGRPTPGPPCSAGPLATGPRLPDPTVRYGWRCRPTGRSTRCCGTPPRSWAEWAARNSWRAESMRPVHRSKTRGPKCFWCAATSLPLGADWPQRPLAPMPVPPLQADHPLTPWPR